MNMRSTYKAAVVVLVTIIMANPALLAWGNPVPGRWEKVAETKPGEKIKVFKKDGVIQDCRYVSINDEFLACSNKDGDRLQIELAAIDKIIVPKAEKYTKHGALWGAAGGACVATLLAVGWSDTTAVGKLMATSIFAGVGAGGGFLTGAVVGGPGETVYISKEAALAK